MSMFAKIMVVVNLLLAVAFLAAAGTLLGAAEDYKGKYEGAQKNWEGERKTLNTNIDSAETRAKEASARYTEADKKLATAEAQLRQLSDSNAVLNSANSQMRADLDKVADAQKDLQGKLADLNKQLDATRGDLATSEAARKEAIDKGKASADEIARLTQERENGDKELAALRADQKRVQEQLDTASTLNARYLAEKGRLSGGVTMEDVHGVVNAVNNAVDIYILSVGSKDKVQPGYEFTIYRGSEYVSTIVIDKVFPNYSSGTTKPGTKKKDVMAGDEAATRL